MEPFLPELWWNLGQLYEACNGHCQDSVEAFGRAKRLSTDEAMLLALAKKLDDKDNWIGGKSDDCEPLLFELNPRNYGKRGLPVVVPQERKSTPYLSMLLS